MRAKKSLGQNFLMHPQIAERIVAVSGVEKGDTVLEIGPGRGMLTRPLLSAAKKVLAIEADAELFHELEQLFAQDIAAGNLDLRLGDVRALDLAVLPQTY